MKRHFVNLVVDSIRTRSFLLRRIMSANLFHPQKENGITEAPKTTMETAELPKPALCFGYSCTKDFGGRLQFMPFGRSREQIVSVDQYGSVLAYDPCSNKVVSMPRLDGCTRQPVPLTVGGSLYLIEACPSLSRHQPQWRCFEALIDGEPPAGVFAMSGWHWHSLPLPPYVNGAGYEPSCDSKICSNTVVDNNIWITAKGIGSYAFNTVSRQWRKAGSWELPFRGGAEYIPEHGFFLGFLAGDKQLFCASDLEASSCSQMPPCRLLEEEEDDLRPHGAHLLSSHLVHVDSDRFCIARYFETYYGPADEPALDESSVVFTGVEVECGCRAHGGLQMVKHNSFRYNFDDKLVHWVF